MTSMSFKNKIERIVILDPALTKGKPIQVGTVDAYTKNDEEIKVNITLFEDIPKEMEEAIKNNPACVRIVERLQPPSEVIFLPSSGKIIT